MTDRAWVYEGTQIGVEATKGVQPASGANVKLPALAISPSVTTETDEFAPPGYKYNTVVINGQEWTEASIEGRGAFNDIVYPLAGMFGNVPAVVPAGAAAGSLARERVWDPSTTGPDDPATFYVQNGSSAGAEAFTYGLMSALGLTISRTSIEVSGSMMGQLSAEGIALTADPTPLTLEPMLPAKASVYLDTTPAAFGVTKLTRCMEAAFEISDKYGVIWPINSSNPSWAGHVETKPDAGGSVTLGMGSTSSGLLAAMRAGTPRFLRYEVLGPVIEGALTYLFQADFAVTPLSPGAKGDSDGLTTRPHDLRIVHSPEWNQAMRFRLVNTLATL